MTTFILNEETSTLGQKMESKMVMSAPETQAAWLIRNDCWTRQLEEQNGTTLLVSSPVGKVKRSVFTRQ